MKKQSIPNLKEHHENIVKLVMSHVEQSKLTYRDPDQDSQVSPVMFYMSNLNSIKENGISEEDIKKIEKEFLESIPTEHLEDAKKEGMMNFIGVLPIHNYDLKNNVSKQLLKDRLSDNLSSAKAVYCSLIIECKTTTVDKIKGTEVRQDSVLVLSESYYGSVTSILSMNKNELGMLELSIDDNDKPMEFTFSEDDDSFQGVLSRFILKDYNLSKPIDNVSSELLDNINMN